MLQMDNLGKQTLTTDASITNRTQERISEIVEVKEERHSLVKENVNYQKPLR